MCCQSRKNLPCFHVWYLITQYLWRILLVCSTRSPLRNAAPGLIPCKCMYHPRQSSRTKILCLFLTPLGDFLPTTLYPVSSLMCLELNLISCLFPFLQEFRAEFVLLLTWNCIKNVTYLNSRQRTPAQAWVGWKFLYLFQRVWHFLSPVVVLLSL